MPAIKGRSIVVKRGDSSPLTAVAGVRTKSVAINGEPIDVTNDDSDGWRELMAEPAEMQISISVSGVLLDDTLKEEAFSASDRIKDMQFVYPDGGVIEGEFYLGSYTDTGEYNGAATFDAKMLQRPATSVYWSEPTSVGLFVDAGGHDQYGSADAADDRTWTDAPGSDNARARNFGIGLDTEVPVDADRPQGGKR